MGYMMRLKSIRGSAHLQALQLEPPVGITGGVNGRQKYTGHQSFEVILTSK
jgi:hypothetical protein